MTKSLLFNKQPAERLNYFRKYMEENLHYNTRTIGNLRNGFLYPIKSGKNTNPQKAPQIIQFSFFEHLAGICIHTADLILLLNIKLCSPAGKTTAALVSDPEKYKPQDDCRLDH